MVVFKALVTTHHLMVHGNEVNEVNLTFLVVEGRRLWKALLLFINQECMFKIIESTILIFCLAIFLKKCEVKHSLGDIEILNITRT